MKLGTENKKQVYILIGLAVVGGYFFYTNVLSQPSDGRPSTPAAPAAAATPAIAVPAPSAGAPAGSRRLPGGRLRANDEFRPSLKPRKEDQIDPTAIDPTLRLDLLAKVQKVEPQGGTRNLFQFGAAPPPEAAKLKGPEPKVLPKTPAQIAKEQQQAKAGPPPKPPPPPILLKYYGYSTTKLDGRKRAFFLDGEDILVATEGETVKRRYRVVKIGVNSVVMEDTESKSQQTLPLQPDVSS